MTDEDKKRITSEPPPPTDEIDGEWGEDSAGKEQPAPPVTAPTRAAEASTPPEMKAASPHDTEAEDADDEDEEEGEDEESEDEEGEDDDAHHGSHSAADDHGHAHGTPRAAAGNDWLPDWAPYAVLAVLVSLSVLVGLGLVGGGSGARGEEAERAAEPAAAAKAPAKPGSHP